MRVSEDKTEKVEYTVAEKQEAFAAVIDALTNIKDKNEYVEPTKDAFACVMAEIGSDKKNMYARQTVHDLKIGKINRLTADIEDLLEDIQAIEQIAKKCDPEQASQSILSIVGSMIIRSVNSMIARVSQWVSPKSGYAEVSSNEDENYQIPTDDRHISVPDSATSDHQESVGAAVKEVRNHKNHDVKGEKQAIIGKDAQRMKI